MRTGRICLGKQSSLYQCVDRENDEIGIEGNEPVSESAFGEMRSPTILPHHARSVSANALGFAISVLFLKGAEFARTFEN